MYKVPTLPKIHEHYFRSFLMTNWAVNAVLTYTVHHLNSTNTSGSYCLKNRQTCSKSHHLYIICSKCLPPARDKISNVNELNRCIMKKWTAHWTCCWRVAPASTAMRSRWRRYFEHDVCYLRLTYWDNNCQSRLWLFSDSLKESNVARGWKKTRL